MTVVIGFDGESGGVGVTAAAESFSGAETVDAVVGAETDADHLADGGGGRIYPVRSPKSLVVE